MRFINELSARHLLWLIMGVVGLSIIMLAFIPFMLKQTSLPFSLGHRANEATAYINGTPFRVHLLTTEYQRVKGLSGQKKLDVNEGMMFVFEKDGQWGIWMKDMLFPIDIIWVAEDGTIVKVEQYVSPDTYPQVFTNEEPARYVFELMSGVTDAYNIEVGTKVTF